NVKVRARAGRLPHLKLADRRADTPVNMQLVSRVPSVSNTAVHLRRLALETHEPIQLVDITDRVAAVVRSSRVTNGLVSIVSRHTTMAVRIQEAEPLLL